MKVRIAPILFGCMPIKASFAAVCLDFIVVCLDNVVVCLDIIAVCANNIGAEANNVSAIRTFALSESKKSCNFAGLLTDKT
ncbi:MAG: hypothetical protein LBL74_00720 [Bacteroidales bacterium]|jgi:hypothetical protein|nr:hypothetical protein [Bacteroidales bacterium]